MAALLSSATTAQLPVVARADKLRDLVEIAGARENQLVGFGLITGLAGTGDDASAPAAAQSTIAMLKRLGVPVDAEQVRLKNVAAVVVTATLPAFAKAGTKLDVTVSSIGNARSLSGGTLVQSLLKGADQKTYAIAQGSVIVGGFKAKGQSGSSTSTGTLTSGRVPAGGLVEQEVASTLVVDGHIDLQLRTPSFGTAANIAKAIETELGAGAAVAQDSGAVRVKVPEDQSDTVGLIARLEAIDVESVHKSRIVISERDGTIIAGGDVRLAPAVIAHGNLTIVVKETKQVSQPIIGKGTTVSASDIQVKEPKPDVRFMKGAATLADVAQALGALGLSARDLASVLEGLRTAGVLEAEIVVQ
ncbi:MAG: flagellar basal body P-ring protein FlgI [Polyangiaceae bacterium]